jgi:PmbA protein
MIVNQVIERAMERAEGAQASVGQGESTTVSFENDKLKSIRSSQTTGISVKVIVNGKMGTSHTTDTDDVDAMVARALEAAEFGAPAHFDFPGPQEAAEVKLYDDAVVPVTKEEMVKIGEEMMSLVKGYNHHILIGAGASKGVRTTQFANSAGTAFTTESTSFALWVDGQLVRGTDLLWAGRSLGLKKRQIDHVEMAQDVIELFKMAEKIAPVKSGNMPVIFTPEGMRVLLLALGLGVDGKNVFLGSSPLAGKLGKRVATRRFSITDNPLIDHAGNSGRYDSEGVPHQVTPLIEDGVLKNYLYDLDTAGRAGTRSTGNGVGCNPTNLVVKEGDTAYEEMVKNTKQGLIVHNVLGLGQGNPLSGEFSVNIHLGYKIENGEVVGRVKNAMLAGNTYHALKHIAAIGDRAQWAGGSLLTPPVQIAELSVVAK